MTLKIGDRVRFLNDVGGGTITAFLDNKMVEVLTDDGFDLPILATELIPEAKSGYGVDEDGSSNSSAPVTSPEPQAMVTLKVEDFRHKPCTGECFLAIVPDNEKLLHVSDFKLYLINDSTYSINYQVSQTEGGVYELLKTGLLSPNAKITLKKFGQTSLSKLKAFRLQGLLFKEGLYDPQPALDITNSIDGISFYKASAFSENEYFNSKALVFKKEELNMEEAIKNLSNNELIKVKQSKENSNTQAQKPKKEIKNDLEEIDLHIEEIVENHTGLSNGEIVNIQLARFETALETALKAQTKRIVFIHGVGNGKLKLELRKKLDRKYPKLKYQDASFKEYGYGATMVNLK